MKRLVVAIAFAMLAGLHAALAADSVTTQRAQARKSSIPSASLVRKLMRDARKFRVTTTDGRSWHRDTTITSGEWSEQFIRLLLGSGEISWGSDDTGVWEGPIREFLPGWERAPDVRVQWRGEEGGGSACVNFRLNRESFHLDGFRGVQKPIGERGQELLVLSSRLFQADSSRFRGYPRPSLPWPRAFRWRAAGVLPDSIPGYALGPSDEEPDDLPILSKIELPAGCSVYKGGDFEQCTIVEVLVGGLGEVAAVRLIRSAPGMDARAMSAVQELRFVPAILDGWPTSIWVRIPLKFDPP